MSALSFAWAEIPDWEWPDLGDASLGCCMGTAHGGPQRCTCWEPVYDAAQLPPSTTKPASVRSAPCDDCAYRPDSPERTGADHVRDDVDDLERLVAAGETFWCHQGMRRPLHYRHPSGATFSPALGLDAAYQPPIVDRVPYKADGAPGDICAGWAARRLAHLRSTTTPTTLEGDDL